MNKKIPIMKCPPTNIILRLRNLTVAIPNNAPEKHEIPISYIFYGIDKP